MNRSIDARSVTRWLRVQLLRKPRRWAYRPEIQASHPQKLKQTTRGDH
jgi:hypothetical protein